MITILLYHTFGKSQVVMLHKVSVRKLLKLYNKSKKRSRPPFASVRKAKPLDRKSQGVTAEREYRKLEELFSLVMVGHRPHISAFLTWWSTFVFNHGGERGGGRTLISAFQIDLECALSLVYLPGNTALNQPRATRPYSFVDLAKSTLTFKVCELSLPY